MGKKLTHGGGTLVDEKGSTKKIYANKDPVTPFSPFSLVVLSNWGHPNSAPHYNIGLIG